MHDTFEPPVVHVPGAFVDVEGNLIPAVLVLTQNGVTPRVALATPEVGGSHATYLTAGTHDLVDYGDY